MRINIADINQYLGNRLEDYSSSFASETLQKMHAWNKNYGYPELSVIDSIFLYHQDSGKPIARIARDMGVSRQAFEKLFLLCDLPLMSRGESCDRRYEIKKLLLEQAGAPPFEIARVHKRKRGALYATREESWAAQSRALTDLWNDPEWRKRMIKSRKDMYDKEYKENMSVAITESHRRRRKSGEVFSDLAAN